MPFRQQSVCGMTRQHKVYYAICVTAFTTPKMCTWKCFATMIQADIFLETKIHFFQTSYLYQFARIWVYIWHIQNVSDHYDSLCVMKNDMTLSETWYDITYSVVNGGVMPRDGYLCVLVIRCIWCVIEYKDICHVTAGSLNYETVRLDNGFGCTNFLLETSII